MTKPDAATRAAEAVRKYRRDNFIGHWKVEEEADIIRAEFAAELKWWEKREKVEKLCEYILRAYENDQQDYINADTENWEPERWKPLIELARSIREEG